MKSGQKRPRLAARIRVTIAAILAFSPVFLTFHLVDRYGVNSLTWDDWERTEIVEKSLEGNLAWKDLRSPYVNHRMILPRLLYTHTARSHGGDVRWEMKLSVVLLAVAAVAYAVLLLGRPGFSPRAWWLVFLVNLLVFNPTNYQSLLWPIQAAYIFHVAALALIILVLTRIRNPWVKLPLAAVLSLAATWSIGFGLLTWLVVGAFVLMDPALRGWKVRGIALAAWIAGAAVVGLDYFGDDFTSQGNVKHSYGVKKGDRPDHAGYIGNAIANPGRTLTFAANLWGSPLVRTFYFDSKAITPLAGWILFAVYAAIAGGVCARARWRRKWLADCLPWLALGGASLAAGLMVAVSLVHWFPPDRGLSPRYICIHTGLGVAILGLLSVVLRRDPEKPGSTISFLAVGIAIGWCLQMWAYGAAQMRQWSHARNQARASIHFLPFFEPAEVQRIDGGLNAFRSRAETMNRLGQLSPPFAQTRSISGFGRSSGTLKRSRAEILRAVVSPDGDSIRISGTASLPGGLGRPADLVLVTAPGPGGGEPSVVGLGEANGAPATTGGAFWDYEFMDLPMDRSHGWPLRTFEATVSTRYLEGLPDPLVLTLWCLDLDRNRLYSFEQSLRWEVAPGRVLIEPEPES